MLGTVVGFAVRRNKPRGRAAMSHGRRASALGGRGSGGERTPPRWTPPRRGRRRSSPGSPAQRGRRPVRREVGRDVPAARARNRPRAPRPARLRCPPRLWPAAPRRACPARPQSPWRGASVRAAGPPARRAPGRVRLRRRLRFGLARGSGFGGFMSSAAATGGAARGSAAPARAARRRQARGQRLGRGRFGLLRTGVGVGRFLGSGEPRLHLLRGAGQPAPARPAQLAAGGEAEPALRPPPRRMRASRRRRGASTPPAAGASCRRARSARRRGRPGARWAR